MEKNLLKVIAAVMVLFAIACYYFGIQKACQGFGTILQVGAAVAIVCILVAALAELVTGKRV